MPAPTTTQPYDSFMLHPTTMRTTIRGFLNAAAVKLGVEPAGKG
jgi:hypothetical protein